jgi:IS5 family transposase
MYQTRKGIQWYFRMKLHIGVDSKTKLVHSIVVYPSNVHDSQDMWDLLHGDETRVWGDSAYAGQTEVLATVAPAAKDFTQKKGSWYDKLSEAERVIIHTKSKVHAKVEHFFGLMKRQFGCNKVRYRELEKNADAVFTK